uniref:Uncharacterized protein n=1 Tax=Leptocylindrus danicus TaxID=163516 RepID=A0A7S2JWB1_9STRA|mmetsp:Transcript_12949/g.19386  ORF Transcript_12949/g.19386 Transcript_12949/m.19386 type:complete len:573 (+) Transcript_12949:1041-2759(+)
MHYRISAPSPFMNCSSFQSYFLCLVGFRTKTPPANITANTNLRMCVARERKWMHRISKSLQELQEKYDRDIRQQKEQQQLLGEFDYDITTKLKSAKAVLDVVDPLKPWIFPWQQYLAILLRFLRFLRSIITWETSKQSFWITLGSITLSFVCLFIPWKLVCLWTARSVVWVFFSPLMKLVDIYYVRKLEGLSEVERQIRNDQAISRKRDQTKEEVSRRRVKREDAFRLRDFKRAQFGRFLIRIPRFTFARYLDIPKVSSSATPHCEKKSTLSELALKESGKNRTIIQGQSLIDSLASGDMILKTKSVPLTIAPTGVAVREFKYLQTDYLYLGNDSRFKALLKLCLILSVAAVLTYMFVPFLRWSVDSVTSCAVSTWRLICNAKSWLEFFRVLKLQVLHLRNKLVSAIVNKKDFALTQASDFIEEKKLLIAKELQHGLLSEFVATTSESFGTARNYTNRWFDSFFHGVVESVYRPYIDRFLQSIPYWTNHVMAMAREKASISNFLQNVTMINYNAIIRELFLFLEDFQNRFLVMLMECQSFLQEWVHNFSKDFTCVKDQVIQDFVNYVYQFIR